MKQPLRLFLLALLATFECAPLIQVTGGGDDVTTTGRLYYQDGSFASQCRVIAVPSNVAPGIGSPAQFETITDSVGKYSFDSLPADTYNIYGTKEKLASYLEAVAIKNVKNANDIPNDTLKPVGCISGIARLSASLDSRTVLVMIIGGIQITWPDDINGHFALKGLAEGTYRIRFLSTDFRYRVLDTTFTVLSGKTTEVGIILLTTQAASDTIMVRDQYINGVWGPNKTYMIMRSIAIPQGERLEIREGTRIIFMGDYDFGTNGNCFAKGTVDNPVLFTYGFNYTGQGWRWLGEYMGQLPEGNVIVDLKADSLVFDHCIFEYCSQPYFKFGKRLAQLYFEMKDCVLRHSLYGIQLQFSDASSPDTATRIVMEHNILPGPAITIQFDGNSDFHFLPCNHQAARIIDNIFYTVKGGPLWIPACFIYYNCYAGVDTTSMSIDDSTRTTCVFGDPKFIDMNNGDYRLAPGSPCIGAGTDGKDIGLQFKK